MNSNKKRGTRRKDFFKRHKTKIQKAQYYARRFGKIFAAVVFALWLGAWVILSGGLEKAKNWSYEEFMAFTAESGFAVENVLVEGRVHTDAQTLMRIIDMDKGDPVLAFDPHKVSEEINALSWVKTARVERRFPDSIYVGLEERVPAALWQRDGQLYLIDLDGEILSRENLKQYKDMIILVGNDANEHAGDFMTLLNAEPELKERVEFATRISGRRWDLKLGNGITVKLPEEDQELAMRKMMDMHKEGDLLKKDIVGIDMRNVDRIVVQPRRGAATTWQAGGI